MENTGQRTGIDARMRRLHSSLARLFAGQFTSVSYSDRYLFNPSSARLASELIRGFADASAKVVVRTFKESRTPQHRDPIELSHDWRNADHRADVIMTLLSPHVASARVAFDHATAHRRRLTLEGAHGACTLFFDQGVGAWRAIGRITFPFQATVERQTKELERPFSIACGRDGTFVAIKTD
jgi:hypothetical protein